MNDTIKAQFFAQYYGVEDIAFGDGYERAFTVSTITLNSKHEYLLLRTVKQLTDGECKIVSDILGVDYDSKNGEAYFDQIGLIEYIKELFEDLNVPEHYFSNLIKIYQYLIRIGILLSFTYLDNNKPHTLTPAQLIELGWVKIKER